MSEPKDFRVGDIVRWYKKMNHDYRAHLVRVIAVRPNALHVEFEPHMGFKTIRYVPYESVEKVRAA